MERERLTRIARGQEKADLVLKNGKIVNVFSGTIEETDLALADAWIVGLGAYQGREEWDISGGYILPGFIEPHIHVESTFLAPGELASTLVPRGTTSLVADPHEIANVLGIAGIQLLLEMSRNLPMDMFFMAPSCVPATALETSGSTLTADDLKVLLDAPRVLGLAEVMNFPGVIGGDPGIMAKLDLFEGRPLDGHAPMLTGRDLNAYLVNGISTDHECTSAEEAAEKLARGMRVFIRQGSQAQNLKDLLPVVNDSNFRRVSWCSDDLHPDRLLADGHIDHILRRAVDLGFDPVRAVTMATLNPAEAYGFSRRGALAPGFRADLVVMDSLTSFRALKVIKNGRLVAENGIPAESPPRERLPEWASPMNVRHVDSEALKVPVQGPRVRVIGLVEHQLITEHLIEDTPESHGWLSADPTRDLARLVVVERHHGSGNIGQGLVKGLGIRNGALASSVAHDSHNIIAAGMSETDLLAAIEEVRRMGGGLVVVKDQRVLAELALPLAGLMTTESARETAKKIKSLGRAAKDLGCRLSDPFMALSFLALPVIPFLKLTDQGLVDVSRFETVPLFSK